VNGREEAPAPRLERESGEGNAVSDPGVIANQGLICGFRFPQQAPAIEIPASEVESALARADGILWLHFNANHTGVRRWLARTDILPPAARAPLEDREHRVRVEALGAGVLAIVNDLTFEGDGDPDEVATLWAYASPQLLVTARAHPLRNLDRLRSAARDGLRADSGFELLARLFAYQAEALESLIKHASAAIERVEDHVLSGGVSEQRESLGRARRMVVHLHRHFAPQRLAMTRLLARPASGFDQTGLANMQAAADELGFLLDQLAGLQERAKLLQEELSSRVNEATSRSLYVLTIFSVVFLPMNLVAGIFGMNVAGLPGLDGDSSFYWAMLAIIASGAVTLIALLLRLA
jgi:zinc transporter